MSLLGRIVVIFFGLIVAIMIAGITLVIGIIAPDWTGIDSDPVERVFFFIASFFATSFVGAVAILPALIVVVLRPSKESCTHVPRFARPSASRTCCSYSQPL